MIIMNRTFQFLSASIGKLELLFTAIAGIALIATMMLITVDVFMRYFMNQPLTWWYDVLTNYVMIALFYLAFSEALRRLEHLSIDVLSQRMSAKSQAIILTILYIIVGPLTIAIGYIGIISAHDSYSNNEVLAGLIAWPVWPGKALAAVSFFVLGLRACLMPYYHFTSKNNERAIEIIEFDN